MFFHLLLRVCTSAFNFKNITDQSIFNRFPSYGFKPGGVLSLSIQTEDNLNDTYFVLSDHYSNMEKTVDHICSRKLMNNITVYVDDLGSRTDSNFLTRKYTIKKGKVFYPFILNCGKKNASVGILRSNLISYLDSRESLNPILLLVIFLLYASTAVIFIINGFLYMNFHIILHTLYICAIVTKLLVLCILIKAYLVCAQENRGCSRINGFLLLNMFGDSAIFSVIYTACSGVSVLKPALEIKQFSFILLNSFLMVFSLYLIVEVEQESLSLGIFFFYQTYKEFLEFTTFIMGFILIGNNLYSTYRNSEPLASKIRHMIEHNGRLMLLQLMFVLFSSYIFLGNIIGSKSFPGSLRLFFFELNIFFSFMISTSYVLFRQSHTPDVFDAQLSEDAHDYCVLVEEPLNMISLIS